jgi:hypothetical protein
LELLDAFRLPCRRSNEFSNPLKRSESPLPLVSAAWSLMIRLTSSCNLVASPLSAVAMPPKKLVRTFIIGFKDAFKLRLAPKVRRIPSTVLRISVRSSSISSIIVCRWLSVKSRALMLRVVESRLSGADRIVRMLEISFRVSVVPFFCESFPASTWARMASGVYC